MIRTKTPKIIRTKKIEKKIEKKFEKFNWKHAFKNTRSVTISNMWIPDKGEVIVSCYENDLTTKNLQNLKNKGALWITLRIDNGHDSHSYQTLKTDQLI